MSRNAQFREWWIHWRQALVLLPASLVVSLPLYRIMAACQQAKASRISREWALARWMTAACVLFLLAGSPARAQELRSSIGPPARIVAVRDPEATDAFKPRLERIRAMVQGAMTNLTHRATPAEAWRTFVRTQDVVGLKVYSLPGPNSGTRPAVVAAVIEGLLAAGLPSAQIVVWDRQTSDLRQAGFFNLATRYGVRVAGSAQAGYDEATFYETALLGNLVWGDLEFGRKDPGIGRKSYVSKLVAKEITKIINITPLLNHNSAGVSGNLYGLAVGSVDNVLRFEADPDRLATAVPEIYALPAVGDHVVLNITDALVCQYEGGEHGLLHYAAALNELRFSTDPVALDLLSLRDLEDQRQANHAPSVKVSDELYKNAALLELGVCDFKRILIERVR